MQLIRLLRKVQIGQTRKRRFNRLFRFFLLFLVLLFCVSSLLYLYRHPILRAMGSALVYESDLHRSDVIVVLSGGRTARIEKAIDLSKQNDSIPILIPLPEVPQSGIPAYDGIMHEVRTCKAMLELREFPQDRVYWSEKAFYSTYDEGLFLKEWLFKNQKKSAIVVPGHFQSRRARWTMDHVFNDSSIEILIAPAAPEIFSTTNWWRHEEGFITVENEIFKSLYYMAKGIFGKP